ncbi:MAG TPA: Na+/H+ antiporter subunit E [Anaeromyxobacteraceae bacterium]|nr:Na+/H+ antiporter subunit E [Anaeromyxobacteraceae bacterium]
MRRLVHHPALSAALFALWLVLAQSISAGTLLLGGALALAAPALAAGLRPLPVRVRRPLVAARLAARVVLDALRANATVIRTILGAGARDQPSRFVRVPLEVRDPNALAVLAMIITATPGTAWAEVSTDRRALLLHVLSVHDEAAVVDDIKRRYERPLMEIFE